MAAEDDARTTLPHNELEPATSQEEVAQNREEEEGPADSDPDESRPTTPSNSATVRQQVRPDSNKVSGSSIQASEALPKVYSCRTVTSDDQPENNTSSTGASSCAIPISSADDLRPYIAQILARPDVDLELVSMRDVRQRLLALRLPGVTPEWTSAHKEEMCAVITAEFDIAVAAWKAAGCPQRRA